MGTVLLFLIALLISIVYEIPATISRYLRGDARSRLIGWVVERSLEHLVAAVKVYMHIRLEYDKSFERLPERFIVIANHQSLLDIPVLMDYFRGRRTLLFVAKSELGMGIPLISSVLRIQGHALVERKGGTIRTMHVLGRFARVCRRNGSCPALFPEGTRSSDGRLKRFHTAGLRRLLEVAPVPVVVVAMDGGAEISSLRRVLMSGRGKRYRVKALAVVNAANDRKATGELLEHARNLIQAQLDLWHGF
ncbi:MAG: 1-acyl-sn-glycerol-3-phosphate acyltransferase [Spirochaetales bacterium]|nr:MAG: 1-acyl-sn-glycerol-3-phosphate acyltransferase [Spirochaetales bacterium]